nr:MAG TPA: hypothetical protein [Caudoviricetes sp.]
MPPNCNSFALQALCLLCKYNSTIKMLTQWVKSSLIKL